MPCRRKLISINILIVEDDPEIAEFFAVIFSDRYRIFVCSTGESAINHIMTHDEVHVAIIDYKLPDISGIELLKKIKALRSSVPIVFTTAFGDEDVVANAFRHGAREYVKKPFSYYEMNKKIEFCLSLKELRRDSARKVVVCEVEPEMTQAERQQKLSSKIQKALKYIDDNYISDVNLDVASERACMSKYHFSRKFRESVGCTFQDYLITLRIEKAKKMLSDEKFSITDIALAVGYNDLSNFERMFKKVLNCTPSHYRKLK